MKRRKTKGVTLVEVVVGVALLASLLVGLLVGASRLDRQNRAAQEKLVASHLLDRVLHDCFAKGFPLPDTLHPTPQSSDWLFSIEERSRAPVRADFRVVRVSMYRTGDARRAVTYVDVFVDGRSLGSGEQP